MDKLVKVSIAAVSLLSAAAVSAAPIYYNSRASFQAAAGSLSMEGFEGPGQLGAVHTYTDFQVSETNGVNAITNYLANSCCVNPVTEGRNAIWFDDNGGSIGTFYNFTGGGVYAFGLDITANEASTVAIGGAAISDSLVLAGNQPQFWGVIDTSPISAITFDASGGPNIGFDDVQYSLSPSSEVPEPGTVALLGVGLAGIGFVRRRKPA